VATEFIAPTPYTIALIRLIRSPSPRSHLSPTPYAGRGE
jgi:hypothetical protein